MFDKVIKNPFGFYSLREIPSQEELNKYYSDKYYQKPIGSYEKVYSDEEVQYINNKIEQKYLVVLDILQIAGIPSLLDVGCGEGWALKYFKKKSWEVMGLDYSEFGCKNQNPDCLKYLMVGDIYANIKLLINDSRKYDCIWLDNVLEHVTEPLMLLENCRKLINDNGILVVEVPNDFSITQQYLFNKGYISKPFWVVNPDHISYFNKEGLTSIFDQTGWTCSFLMGDYPIDFNLFNINTNYVEDKSKGKACHNSRITIENFLHSLSPKKVNELYRILAELGLGRQIIGFFQGKVEI